VLSPCRIVPPLGVHDRVPGGAECIVITSYWRASIGPWSYVRPRHVVAYFGPRHVVSSRNENVISGRHLAWPERSKASCRPRLGQVARHSIPAGIMRGSRSGSPEGIRKFLQNGLTLGSVVIEFPLPFDQRAGSSVRAAQQWSRNRSERHGAWRCVRKHDWAQGRATLAAATSAGPQELDLCLSVPSRIDPLTEGTRVRAPMLSPPCNRLTRGSLGYRGLRLALSTRPKRNASP
jgi:hypothetical protein